MNILKSLNSFLSHYLLYQVKWCSSSGASNKPRQTKIAIASAISFQGFKQKLFCLPIVRLWVCHVFCSLHSAFVTVAYFIIQSQFNPFSLHLLPVGTGHHYASFLSLAFHNAGYQLFSSPA
jgi:hypothetical protein